MKKLKRRLERLEAAVPPADEEAERREQEAFLQSLTVPELERLEALLVALLERHPEAAGNLTGALLTDPAFQEEAEWLEALCERFEAGQGSGPGAA